MRKNELKKKFTEWMNKGGEYLHLEELGIRLGLCIVDVVWLSRDEFIGVELKTKYDTLERLPRQMDYMLSIFDRVVVCLHEKHLRDYDKLELSERVKVISYDDWGVFTVRSDGETNKKVQLDALIAVLQEKELVSTIKHYGVCVDPTKPAHTVPQQIAQALTHIQLRMEVIEAMHKRIELGERKHESSNIN